MDSLIGKRLGQYEILSKLGSGGMANVYKARQTSVDRDVAVKVIRTDLTEDAAFMERFAREARTIASLSHLHILKVFDYGQQDGVAYLVMELLEGGSLNTLIQKTGALSLSITARILKQISGALDYAHDKGIVHRDLKSDNVLLDSAENAYLTDFGIARLLNDTSKMTQTGTIMGTPAYMAPELWTGKAADKQADIYALGVILYEMLAGNTPFSGDTPFVVMYQHLNEMPPVDNFNADIPAAVESVILKAMAKKPEDRYPSAGELANAFDEAIGGISQTKHGVVVKPKADEVTVEDGQPTQMLPRPTDPTEASKATVVEKRPTQPQQQTITTAKKSSNGLVWGAGIAAVIIVLGALLVVPRVQQQQADASATAVAMAATQTQAAMPTATVTPSQTPTVSPTPAPTDTPAATALAFDQLQFDTYTNKDLNIVFRYPRGWDVQVVKDQSIFVTEDFKKLDFSDLTKGVMGAPYIQLNIGDAESLGALDMKSAQTAQDALVAFLGRDRITNLDAVPGGRFPTATTTRTKSDLGVVRYIYSVIMGPNYFNIAMLQASPDVAAAYNTAIMLPLIRSIDTYSKDISTSTPAVTSTPVPTVFFATPSSFATQDDPQIGVSFVYPKGWVFVANLQSGAALPANSPSLDQFSNDDFNRPMNIFMKFDKNGFIAVKNPNDSIQVIFNDNYGSYTVNPTQLYDAPFPTVYARAGEQPVYGIAVAGWVALVKVRDDLYISIFAHAGRGKEDAFLEGVLLPMLRGMKATEIRTATPNTPQSSGSLIS